MKMRNSVAPLIKFSALLLILLCISCTHNTQKERTAAQKTAQNSKNNKKKTKQKLNKPLVPLNDNNLEKELLSYGKENPETLILLKTPKGNMKIKLYENTPLHRANIIRLIKNNFYKETQFYRVVNNFMIQGGDNDDWERINIKNKMGNYTIPAEFRKENIHKKGAVSMAREYENNPEKRSVSFEFFIVQGTQYTAGELLGAEQQYGLKITPEDKIIYQTIGGTPHLDGKHTVFAQVIEGLNVIDSIAAVKVDEGDWPIQNITLEFQILE
jgi:peptidyl-prolyl cis-trans isomerase B (cyclophilin B)